MFYGTSCLPVFFLLRYNHTTLTLHAGGEIIIFIVGMEWMRVELPETLLPVFLSPLFTHVSETFKNLIHVVKKKISTHEWILPKPTRVSMLPLLALCTAW